MLRTVHRRHELNVYKIQFEPAQTEKKQQSPISHYSKNFSTILARSHQLLENANLIGLWNSIWNIDLLSIIIIYLLC